MLLHEWLRKMSIARHACAAAAFFLVGCGDDDVDLNEESTGTVDLVPSSTAANPTLVLPRTIAPSRGWANGTRIEFYNFGAVTMLRQRSGTGSLTNVPDVTPVPSIYFFYNSQGQALSSKPVYEARTGSWSMPGGLGVLDPTPIPAPADDAAKSAYYGAPYFTRPRNLLVDDVRGVADYQRPVIDLLPSQMGYLGVWEIVEVTVDDSSYQIDGIKSLSTMQMGIDSGQLRAHSTGIVIDCPVLDERTKVQPSVMHNNVPRPRIEVWYRTRLGSCFLANGWESIGETVDPQVSATDRSNLRLFRAGVDQDRRLNTFDVTTQEIGVENDRKTVIAVPPGRLYTPTVTISMPPAPVAVTRYPGDDLAIALPRRTAADAGGYSPLAWLYDINVPQDPPYQPGTFKDFAQVDPATTTPRRESTATQGVVTQNVAIIGTATPCTTDADCRFGQVCNPLPDANLATTDPPSGQNIADVMIQREGGARCDVPAVGFGGYCSVGVARCDVQSAVGSENEKRLKDLGAGPAGPAFTVHADLATAETNLSNAQSLAMGVDPKDPTRVVPPAEQMAAQMSIPGLETTASNLRTRVAAYDAAGMTVDYAGYGYFCYPGAAGTSGPAGTANGIGSCQIRCNIGASASAGMVSVIISSGGEDSASTMGFWAMR